MKTADIWWDRSRGEVYLLLQLMNEAEYLMKNYGDRGGCYPPFFVFTTKTTHPRPQVFSVNDALTFHVGPHVGNCEG